MLHWFDGSDDPTLRRQFEWLSEWSTWEQVAVFLAAAIVLGLTIYNYRRLRPVRRRVGLIALRTGALALLLYVFYQPAFIDERVQRSRNTVVVLVDDSQSLELPDRDGTRLDTLRAFLKRSASVFEAIAGDHDVEMMRFADFLEPLDAEDPAAAITGTGQGTDLLGAIEEAVERFRTRRLGGFVIVSDGVDTGKLAARLEDAVGLDAETRRFLEQLGAPVHGIGFRDATDVRDVAVHALRATSFAFHLNATSLDANVRVVGYPPGTSVPVSLLEDGKVVHTRTLTVKPDQRDYALTFDFVPRELGDRVYSVVAEPLPGEIYEPNNERSAVIKVIRDRIRVLQICGQTSWDQRFLRNLLKRNPNVDLISFFILINTAYAGQLSSRDTSLIPFPAYELFVEELGGFDLIVFQNFNHGPFQTREHLWRVRDFVKQGGGFLMVGGPRSFSEGGYQTTELADVLPVELPMGFGDGRSIDREPFRPSITKAGAGHPITQLSLEPRVNQSLWEGLPELEGLNKTSRLRPGAVSLLDHPSLRDADGQPMSVVAATEAGEGRVLAVTTDSTWLWSMLGGEGGTSGDAYTEFWTNAIRWLIRDPELELVRISLESASRPLGRPVELQVSVFGTDYQPAVDHPLSVQVTRRGSVRRWADPTVVYDEANLRTDERGRQTIRLEPERAGVYEVRAAARVGDRRAEARQMFLVLDTNPEFETTVPPLDYLALLAEASGGEVFDIRGDAEPEFAPPRVTQIIERSETPLWSGVDILALAALLLGGEWWLRRKYGYL